MNSQAPDVESGSIVKTVKWWSYQYVLMVWIVISIRHSTGYLQFGYNPIVETAVISALATPVFVLAVAIGLSALGLLILVTYLSANIAVLVLCLVWDWKTNVS